MDNKVNEACKKLYGGMEEIISDYIKLLNTIQAFEKKWDIQDDSKTNRVSSVQEVESELRILKNQIMRNTKKCIVFGKTSVGKSTFINALLGENILPSGCGSTSKYFCGIQASPKNYNYVIVDVSDRERRLDEISEINRQMTTENLKRRPYIHLFYDRQRCELLNEDVVIIDTPATDTHNGLDRDVEILCREADVIILLVSAVGTLQSSDSDFITRNKTIFAKLTVLIVYTWWDHVQKKDKCDSLKKEHIEKAKKFLCTELNYPEDVAMRNIYFLSGEERLESVSQNWTDSSVRNNDLWTQRKYDFDTFFKFLKRKLSENAVVRKHNYLQTVYSNLSSTIFNPESFINQISRKKNILAQNLKSINKEKINYEINLKLSNIIESSLQKFVVEANEKEEETNQRLYELFNEVIDRSMDELKLKIIDLLRDNDERIYSKRKQIVMEIYFPNYLDVTDKKRSMDIRSLNTNLRSMREKNKTVTIVTAVTTGTLALSVALAGGIWLTSSVVVGIGLGLIGGAGAGGTSARIMTALKNQIYFLFKENVQNIKAKWNTLESPLLDSYLRFINNLDADISQLFSPIESEFQQIQVKLNNLNNELKIFLNLADSL